MRKEIELTAAFRKLLLTLLDELSLEQINTIPPGFNNNLVWQLGHVIAVQQAICYKRSQNAPVVADALIDRYKKDTRPEKPLSAEEYEELKQVSATSMAQLDKDFDDGVFAGFEAFTLGNGVEVASIQDALVMIAAHEALHYGYAQALRRAVVGGNDPA